MKYPMILHIHGGPHAMFSPAYNHEFQLLASQGYVVLYVNPRGSFGYGQTFAQAERDYVQEDLVTKNLYLHEDEIYSLRELLSRQWDIVTEQERDEQRIRVRIELKYQNP